MAKLKMKEKKSTEKPAAAAKGKTEKSSSGKVGVDYIAKELGITAFTVRGKLRALEIEKDGRSYEWSKTDADKIIKKMKAMNAE